MSKIAVMENGAIKTIDFSAWGGVDNFLAVSGSAVDNLPALRKIVPWLNKAVVMSGNAVSQLPYEFYREENKLDDPQWGALRGHQTLFYKLACSLTSGAAYALLDMTSRAIIDIQYCAPNTITPNFNQATGELINFTRSYNGVREIVPPEKMLYIWLPDDTVETGAAQVTPLTNAALSAALLAAMDSTLKTYGDNGFIAPMFAVAEGVTQAERERAETVLSQFVRGMWRRVVKVVNAQKLVPQRVGAGMDELKGSYIEITRQQIENIAASFGIPVSLFLSNSANYATAISDRRMWYESGVFVTLYQAIEDAFNNQVWERLGLEAKFNIESIDAFQEEESDKSGSLSALASTFSQYPDEAIIAAGILGYDLTPEQVADIEALAEEEEPEEEETVEPMTLPTEEENAIAEEMKSWRKFLEKPRKREYECKAIPPALELKIRAGLKAVKTAEEIDAVFADAVKESPLVALAKAIENAATR